MPFIANLVCFYYMATPYGYQIPQNFLGVWEYLVLNKSYDYGGTVSPGTGSVSSSYESLKDSSLTKEILQINKVEAVNDTVFLSYHTDLYAPSNTNGDTAQFASSPTGSYSGKIKIYHIGSSTKVIVVNIDSVFNSYSGTSFQNYKVSYKSDTLSGYKREGNLDDRHINFEYLEKIGIVSGASRERKQLGGSTGHYWGVIYTSDAKLIRSNGEMFDQGDVKRITGIGFYRPEMAKGVQNTIKLQGALFDIRGRRLSEASARQFTFSRDHAASTR